MVPLGVLVPWAPAVVVSVPSAIVPSSVSSASEVTARLLAAAVLFAPAVVSSVPATVLFVPVSVLLAPVAVLFVPVAALSLPVVAPPKKDEMALAGSTGPPSKVRPRAEALPVPSSSSRMMEASACAPQPLVVQSRGVPSITTRSS
jgi:hypothetical protein